MDICVEAELDEQWSFVGNKRNQMWLQYAIVKTNKTVLVFTFEHLLKLLEQIHIDHYYTDAQGIYSKYLEASKHFITQKETQNIGRKNLDLRTRIKRLNRKTICFSKSEVVHIFKIQI